MVECITLAFQDYRTRGPKELDSMRYYVFTVRDDKGLVRVEVSIDNKRLKAERGYSYKDGSAGYAIDLRTMKIVDRTFN